MYFTAHLKLRRVDCLRSSDDVPSKNGPTNAPCTHEHMQNHLFAQILTDLLYTDRILGQIKGTFFAPVYVAIPVFKGCQRTEKNYGPNLSVYTSRARDCWFNPRQWHNDHVFPN